MKKIIYTLSIVFGLALSANAQIESLAGPRLGIAIISPGMTSHFINGEVDLDEITDDWDTDPDITDNASAAFLTLYGWQWESRFADGGDVTGIVEWVVLVGGMEKGLFLPSVSSLVGARTYSGLEFAAGPNLSLSGVAMVLGAGYNFKSGDLNIPVNIAFVPNMKKKYTEGHYNDGEETETKWSHNTGARFSITVGFNMGR